MAKKSGNSATFNDAVFRSRMQKLARKFEVDEKDFVRDQSAQMARDVAKFTPPYDGFPSKSGSSIGSKKGQVAGAKAVTRDIDQIVTVQKQGVISWALSEFGRGGIWRGGQSTSKGVLLTMSELARWHRANRKPNGKTERLDHSERYWVSERLFSAYVKAEMTKVGIAKAAFAKAAVQLGAKGSIPAWVKRHLSGVSGSGKIAKTGKGPYGIARGVAGGLWHVVRLLPMIERDRLIKAEARLKYIIRAAAKSSGFKTK